MTDSGTDIVVVAVVAMASIGEEVATVAVMITPMVSKVFLCTECKCAICFGGSDRVES